MDLNIDKLKTLARTLAPLGQLAEALERIQSIEQAEQDGLTRVAAVRGELAGLVQQTEEATARIHEAEQRAAAIDDAAKQRSRAIVDDAEAEAKEQGAGIIHAAQAQADGIVAAARAELAELTAKIAQAREDHAAQVELNNQSDLECQEKSAKLAELRAAIAKITGG